jgi:hypothetical protein
MKEVILLEPGKEITVKAKRLTVKEAAVLEKSIEPPSLETLRQFVRAHAGDIYRLQSEERIADEIQDADALRMQEAPELSALIRNLRVDQVPPRTVLHEVKNVFMEGGRLQPKQAKDAAKTFVGFLTEIAAGIPKI